MKTLKFIGQIKETYLGFFRRVHPDVVQWVPKQGKIQELSNKEAQAMYSYQKKNGYTIPNK
jgi:hypothetical protein